MFSAVAASVVELPVPMRSASASSWMSSDVMPVSVGTQIRRDSSCSRIRMMPAPLCLLSLKVIVYGEQSLRALGLLSLV